MRHYVHDMWTEEDGLGSNTVRDILKTRDGYLWLATHGGLARFDGLRFTVFNMANTPAFASDYLLVLAEGPDGSLWIGSEGGGFLLDQLGQGAVDVTKA